MWKLLKRSVFCFFLCFSVASVGICSEYIVSEPQLKRLETNLIQLKELNEQLQTELETLHQRSENQEKLLESVNQSFEQYANSQQKKIRQLKLTRALCIVGGIALAFVGR